MTSITENNQMLTDPKNTSTSRVLKRGEIWNVIDGDTKPIGTEMWANRPAIIVSNDVTNEKAQFVLVVYLTTSKKRPLPTHIEVTSGDKKATALCEQIFAVDKSRITFSVGKTTKQELMDIDRALLFSLGIANTVKPTTLFTKWVRYIDRYHIDLNEKENNCDVTKSLTSYQTNCYSNKQFIKLQKQLEDTQAKLEKTEIALRNMKFERNFYKEQFESKEKELQQMCNKLITTIPKT